MSVIVAADDYHGGQKVGPSIELLARTIWISCLVFYYSRRGFLPASRGDHMLDPGWYYCIVSNFLIVLCLLSLAKIILKLYAFQKARQSLALGRNCCLIAGYMEKLQGDERPRASGDEELIPPLIVMGEEKQVVEETPHGFTIKQRNSSLVTVDMVWRMASTSSDILLVSQPWLKDLCLSFALFKLLRCRFARAHLAESGCAKMFNFVLDVLLNNGSPDSVFSVIADEIYFVLDSYYSSLPASNSCRLLPFLNITVSLSIITWCLVGCAISHRYSVHHPRQIFCSPNPASCMIPPQYLNDAPHYRNGDRGYRIAFGNIIFNVLPTFSLFVAVIIAEAWEIISYLCSSWVKVTMICSYITQASWQRSPRVQRWLGRIMKLRIKFRRGWSDHMGQMSLLPARRQQPEMRYGLSWLLFSFSDPRIQHVEVPSAVKAAIVYALKGSNGNLSKGTAALRKSRIGGRLLWACEGQGTSDVILAWHISTCIFDERHGIASSTSSRSAENRAVATHLSQYCAYLMAAAPQLLPDHRAWSKKLCETVSRDIERALAGGPVQHDGVVSRLSERSEHETVKRGVTLGKQLLELIPDETGWALLASFWSEILLYIAASDNLTKHKKAIASGTELLTLVWALLTHAGIVTRPGTRTVA